MAKRQPHATLQTPLPAAPRGESGGGLDLYDEILCRVESRLPRLLAREERRLRKVIEHLRQKGPHKLPSARVPRFVALQAYRDLSWELRHESPAQMLELSRLALQEAEHLEVERELGWERSRSLAALAWAEVGNALRVNDRFEEAEQAFGMARHCLRIGDAGERLRARIHTLESSLFADRGDLSRSIEALDTAIEIYLRLGENHLAGSACVTKGHHLLEAGDHERALQVTRDGLARLEAERDRAIFHTGVHNVVRSLLKTGRALEAQALLRQHQASEGVGKLLRLRQSWLEGEIAADLGAFEEAEASLLHARLGLRAAGRPFDAAVVAIEMASIQLRQGRAEASRCLCLEAGEELFALNLESEAHTAILMLMKAHQVGSATVQLLNGIANYLSQSEPKRKAVAESSSRP